ncbi:MAG: hypothetical protein Aurels2KO_12210 [Aureliella sp.]
MMRLGEVSEFCRRMGVSLRAGVDILKVLENETRSGRPQHRKVMENIREHILDGGSLAKSMLEEKSHFPPLLIQMVHASEMGGRLESMFLYMADYYRELKKTRADFLGKISWPIFQLFLAVVIIGLVILLQAILSPSSGTAYDATALGFTGYSGFYTYCMLMTVVFTVSGVVIWGIWKNWFNCHRILMPFVQRIPTLGTALVTLGLARLSMTLSMLLNAGVEARRSLKQSFLSTGNYYYISGMDRALESVEQGNSFGDAFEASEVLPKEFVDNVRVGELSGTETESLDHLAEQYRERAKAALATIAMIASMAIRLCVMLFLAFIVIRMGLQYIGLLTSLTS